MTIHLIELEIALLASMAEMEAAIATQLQQYGEPLRWAITHVDPVQRTAQIEAVVTVGEYYPSSL